MYLTIWKAIVETKPHSQDRAHRIENIVDAELYEHESIENYSFNLKKAMEQAKAIEPAAREYIDLIAYDLVEAIIQEYDAHQ